MDIEALSALLTAVRSRETERRIILFGSAAFLVSLASAVLAELDVRPSSLSLEGVMFYWKATQTILMNAEVALPNPPLMRPVHGNAIRSRWIGKRVRVNRRHIKSPHPVHPEAATIRLRQETWRQRGIGTILEVGPEMWFLIRWETGEESTDHQSDIEPVP